MCSAGKESIAPVDLRGGLFLAQLGAEKVAELVEIQHSCRGRNANGGQTPGLRMRLVPEWGISEREVWAHGGAARRGEARRGAARRGEAAWQSKAGFWCAHAHANGSLAPLPSWS